MHFAVEAEEYGIAFCDAQRDSNNLLGRYQLHIYTQLGSKDVLLSNKSKLIGIPSAVALSLVGARATAADTSAASSTDTTSQIQEIVVTATKREVSEQQVAGGITALSGNALQEQGILNYDDLVRSVPGVIDSGASNTNKFVVRGIETSNRCV